MKRTQLYIDEHLWTMLELRANRDGTSVSEAVRRILRQELESDSEDRKKAMLGVIGLWKDRDDLPDTATYVRSLRQSPRRWQKLQ